MTFTWEPVKPSVAVATEAFQHLQYLNRRYPDDVELANALEAARHLLDVVWTEYDAARRAGL
jgi:hypothetical protein